MPQIQFAGVAYEATPGETVLDALLRWGIDVAHSCRAGACQSCLLRAVTGSVPVPAQRGLKATLAEQGYFLACLCRPEGDLRIEPAGGLEVRATIAAVDRLTPTVLRLYLSPEEPFAYRAGQYLTLLRPDGLARSYSLASLPDSPHLELHIRRAPQGRMSGWLFDEAVAGMPIAVRGPAGDCFYTGGDLGQPLLMAGTGTGLAPLLGILRDALRQGHHGPIHFFHGALRPEGLYCQDELQLLANNYPNLHYCPTVLEGVLQGDQTALVVGPLDQVIARQHPRLQGWRGFLCGSPSIVRTLTKRLFLAGMASREIFADAFVEASPPVLPTNGAHEWGPRIGPTNRAHE